MDHGTRWIVDIRSSETFRILSLWFGTCPKEGRGSFTTFRPCRIIALVVLTILLRYMRCNIIGRRGKWSFHRCERERQNCHAISRTSTLYECWNFRSKGIYHRISTIYGNKVIIESFVRRWVREFNTSRETVWWWKRGGRPSLVTEDVKKRVCNLR